MARLQKLDGRECDVPLFFSAVEWMTIDSAVARIYPTDNEPGAREAKVVRFIDRYLSGIDFVFANADGSGFLAIAGKQAEAWQSRIARLQSTYRAGIGQLDALSVAHFAVPFRFLDEQKQDQVLEALSGAPRPTQIKTGDTGEAHVQNVSDDALPFFDALALHTRQGMFCDPVYGGNHARVGWTMIGFPGPQSLAHTRDCSYGHANKFLDDESWADLIPQLRHAATDGARGARRSDDER